MVVVDLGALPLSKGGMTFGGSASAKETQTSGGRGQHTPPAFVFAFWRSQVSSLAAWQAAGGRCCRRAADVLLTCHRVHARGSQP